MTPEMATAPLATGPSEVKSTAKCTDVLTVTRVSNVHMPSYAAGMLHGFEIGRRLEVDERDAGLLTQASGIPSDELERCRWTLRGEQRTRATFGLPHKDDFRGRGVAA